MEFEIGKKYNFFDDGKISISRHYIAEVKDIIPFHEFYMSNFIEKVIQDYLDYNYNIYRRPTRSNCLHY